MTIQANFTFYDWVQICQDKTDLQTVCWIILYFFLYLIEILVYKTSIFIHNGKKINQSHSGVARVSNA